MDRPRNKDWRARRHGGASPSVEEAREPCGCASSTLPKLADRCADDHEILAISLSRFIFVGYASGRSQAWDAGLDVADAVLGEEGGANFFGRVLQLARAVRAERMGNFVFRPGGCCAISEDEQELLTAIHAARGGPCPQLDRALLALARHLDAPRTLAALLSLGAALGRPGQQRGPAGLTESGATGGALH